MSVERILKFDVTDGKSCKALLRKLLFGNAGILPWFVCVDVCALPLRTFGAFNSERCALLLRN